VVAGLVGQVPEGVQPLDLRNGLLKRGKAMVLVKPMALRVDRVDRR